MKLLRFVKLLVAVGILAGLGTAAFFTREMWLPWFQPAKPVAEVEASSETATPATKVIVNDQAQKNLGLTAKPLKAETVWKTILVPGMVVDRPGYSDRNVAAPLTGVVIAIHHFPGETVRPGAPLFTLRLVSEALHQTQSELFKTGKEIEIIKDEKTRLSTPPIVTPPGRFIELDNQLRRQNAVAQAYRTELLARGLSPEQIENVAKGNFVSEIPVVVPSRPTGHKPLTTSLVKKTFNPIPGMTEAQLAFEVQELKVELGQQVQAGQTLCMLSNHQSLAIEGRAFREEMTLLERSFKGGWPVEVDFQEDATAGWGVFEQLLSIRNIDNNIDPINRTFGFLLPLENQSKAVERDGKTNLLWRFRPGQKVRLRIRVQEVENVFVLPPDAVVHDGPEAFVFTQNVNTFERKSVHVLFQERERVVLANDGALPTYQKEKEVWTIPVIAQTAAAQLNRMAKAGSGGVPKGYHVHADGSLHKNEDEGK